MTPIIDFQQALVPGTAGIRLPCCSVCGACVLDFVTHQEWHAALSSETVDHDDDKQREVALALHKAGGTGNDGTFCTGCTDYYPCPTARALGVTA